MEAIDNYLQPRAPITDNTDMQHVQEVGGVCPLCGKFLLIKKGARVNKQYQIAHIFPNSPNEHQKKELAGLERLGNSCEDFENKIALCKDCHGYYDDHTTREEYLKILAIKKELLETNKIRERLATEDIEKELILIIEKLSNVKDEDIEKVSLKYKGIKLANKIEIEYCLLRRKVAFNVCTYYGFIRENMKILSDQKRLNFDLLASEIKTAYLKAIQDADDKVIVFNMLVNWINSKIVEASKESCEIMVSFFVQNCEVFDEISK